MKRFITCILKLSSIIAKAQIGIKAGLNFANITKAEEINGSSRTGFHAGLFLSGPTKSVLSSQTEIPFSRQGYDFSTNVNTGFKFGKEEK